MSQNFNCERIRELFSSCLDAEASAEEQDLLTGHLLLCEDCRQEFDLWKKISETLRCEAAHEEPTEGFSSRVVSRLDSDRRVRTFPWRRVFNSWRVPAAAAAAAVMLFAGSWGVGVALKGQGQETGLIAEHTQPANPGVNAETVSPQETGGQTVDNQAPANQPENPAQEEKPAAPQSTAAVPERTESGNTVLLDSNKNIPSTILKIATNNPSVSRDIALEMAADNGGGGQVLDNQKKAGGELTIIRMTVPRNSGSNLVTSLTGLGGIIERSDSKADITSNYNAALNRLADIKATIEPGISADEKSRLESEASALKRQIEKWDNEIQSYTVILWLEQQ